jgi:hypothetical protein
MRIGAAYSADRNCPGISPEDLYDEQGMPR